jgi:hypothetical protein
LGRGKKMANIDEIDREKGKMPRWSKYHTASLITMIFLGFVLGWLFIIPIAVIFMLLYGLIELKKDRKNRIAVTIKPNEAMRALARKEEELRREKERLFEEMQRGISK